MKPVNNIIVLVLVFVLKLHITLAQNYPVQVTTILSPPFSGYMPDYGSLGNQSLRLLVQFNDFTKPSYTIKLKFKLTGQTINLESKSYYYEGPFTLVPGVPLEISGADIAGLLNSNNLDFTGLSKQQYETSKVLPEGLYTLCFTAYDFNNPSEIQVSNQSCFSAWMMLNDPPYLNIPFCGNVQPVTTPQNIIFQWTSMNLVSPNSANNTAYEFSLYEIIPKGADPNNILQTLPPIYQTTTNITTLNYGLTEPVLNLGMDYVWRVKAIDLSGRDLFKNNGYSQLCTFSYGNMTQFIDSNALVLNLQGVGLNYRLAKCFWNPLSVYKNYKVYYRKQNGANWFNNSGVTESYNLLSNLEPNSTYQAYVKGILLDNTEGPASNTITITTPQKTDFACGQGSAPPPTQTKPLLVGAKGQIWEIGQFDVVVTGLNNFASPIGQYSGFGNVNVPFLGNSKFNVKFTNIIVNEEYQIIAGQVDVITQGIGNWTHSIDVLKAEENATYINGSITGFSVTGNQYCYTTITNTTAVCDTLPSTGNVFVVRDEEGNQYTVQLNPPPPTVSGPTNYFEYSTDSLAANDSTIVFFNASAAQSFGFDKKEYAAFVKNYEIIKLKNNKNYFVSNKSVGESQTDEVMAQVQILNFNASLLDFKTVAGTLLNKINEGNNIYKITGITNTSCVYAWYNNKKIGKLNITNLKSLTKKVVLVPVNNANISVTNSQLNVIFKQANVSWSVTTAPNFTFNLGIDGLEAADAHLFSKYSAEMRALRDTFKLHDSLYDKTAYYLFVVPAFSNHDIKGYMVRGRALGFITPNASIKEIAHELAHGAFGLEHTFPKIAKSSSNNLMDYGQDVKMIKEQWLKSHFVAPTFSWFDDEEDASYLGKNNTAANVFFWIAKIKLAYKNHTTVSIPPNEKLIGESDKCYLAGIDYNYIRIFVEDRHTEYQAEVRNKITTGLVSIISSTQYTTTTCLKIDNAKIIIQVPLDRITHMKTYLESTSTYKNLILFVNGYRPIVNINGDPVNIALEYKDSDNQVEYGDSRGYWKGIDAQFMNRINTRQAVYADGHHGVCTSNHLTTLIYTAANIESELIKDYCKRFPPGLCPYSHSSYLHTRANTIGFAKRVASGKDAGQDLIQKINSGMIIFNKQVDTLDIVAHSMGYAYSVGMINELHKGGIKFGRFYILAPENACSGGVDWKMFTEVYQYGSDFGQPNADPPWEQDGVAPQCECMGLSNANGKNNPGNNKPVKAGRIFIPKNYTPKGFLDCHTVANYNWIFNKTQNDKGYVKPRN